MVRLNITMPEELVKELRRIKNKSQFIAEALREKFKKEKNKELEAIMMEGYKSMVKTDQEVNENWEKATLDEHWS